MLGLWISILASCRPTLNKGYEIEISSICNLNVNPNVNRNVSCAQNVKAGKAFVGVLGLLG